MPTKTVEEPTFVRGGMDRPVISTAAPAEVRQILLSERGDFDFVDLAEKVVNSQLSNWRKDNEATKKKDSGLQIFDVDVSKLGFGGRQLGDDVVEDVQIIADAIADEANKKKIWGWERLPYSVRCAGVKQFGELQPTEAAGDAKRPKKKAKRESDDALVFDVDEWVLKNEVYLRLLSRKHLLDPNPEKFPWSYGLLRLRDLPGAVGTNGETLTQNSGEPLALKITRPAVATLPGFSVLTEKRKTSIFLQPSVEAFKSRWNSMTDNLLQGLDWSNIFVAGGTALGALLTPEIPTNHSDYGTVNKQSEWQSSDIDVYIYGLSPDEANKKIQHIGEVYRKNLPPDSPFLVVRNSQTITFYSKFPLKRVQIVLKLIGSPRDVLLNFDLDICAVGFDGSEVWMLPRCARALETATNVFTMDLINGHYLGDRKATRDQRVFKYADKGYGLRILPSYTIHLSTISKPSLTKHTTPLARGEHLLTPPYSLPKIAEASREWTKECMKNYSECSEYDGRPFHWPRNSYEPVKREDGKPVFSHAMLESYAQVTAEPLGMSCLTGFSLFMRHVALWEAEGRGDIVIQRDLWADNTYGEGLAEVAYDDSPAYKWDPDFTVTEFCKSIDEYNTKEKTHFLDNCSYNLEPDAESKDKIDKLTQRVSYAPSVEEALSPEKDVVIPLFVDDERFIGFANGIVGEALEDAGIVEKGEKREGPVEFLCGPEKDEKARHAEDKEPTAALWRLDKVLNWQMLDRRIDEIREVLWAFHRVHERDGIHNKDEQFKTQLSKRAIRITVQDEMDAFVRWVGRRPYHTEPKINAHYLLGDGDYDDDF